LGVFLCPRFHHFFAGATSSNVSVFIVLPFTKKSRAANFRAPLNSASALSHGPLPKLTHGSRSASRNREVQYDFDKPRSDYRADGSEAQRGFNLKTDLTRLGNMLDEIGGAALIVIDPITAYLGETDSHKNAEIRALLSPLSELAAKHGAAVVCVSHLNKSAGGDPLMRVTGSLAFVAAARAAYIVAKDPENDARRLFLPMKNNIGNDQTGLAFAIQSAQVKSPAGLIETSRIAWEPDPVTTTADEAMQPQGDPEERSALDDARQFLESLLADGPVKAGQIKADADGAGFNWRTIQRAADRLNIERHKNGMKGGWTWKLPPKMTSTPEDDRHETLSPSGSLVAFGEDVPDF